MKTIDLNSLSKEQKLELMKQLEAEEAVRKQKIKDDRDAYRTIVDETITKVFETLRELSGRLSVVKNYVYNSFGDIMDMKKDVYGEQIDDQYSHTFTTNDGNLRIKLGHHVMDDYDDTVNVGIEKVKKYISSLGKDDDSRRLVEAVLRLLSRNKEGKLHASRVVQLSKMADESGNPYFVEGVKIIRDAHRPTRSKSYVQAWYRDGKNNEWVSLPLGITEA
ncbi:MAG TPA: DUF3164 family protein [Dissulfurispiraceae bacterium]|nr:DUF3164 family protein [Dissulfurispiraceae bacterium]